MRPRVFFVVSVLQFSRESFPLLEQFREKEFDVHVLAGWSGVTADEYVARCVDAGFTVHRPPPELRYPDPRVTAGARPPLGVAEDLGAVRSLRRGAGLALLDVYTILAALKRFASIKRFAAKLLDDVEPQVVLAGPFHSCGMVDEGIAKVATQRQIAYCCYSVRPYLGERYVISTRFSDADQVRLSRNLRADERGVNRLLARAFPSWTRTLNGLRMFPFDPRVMLAAKLARFLPKNPWQQPSELFDLCLVESDFSRDLLLKSAFDPQKIAVTGKPLLDDVFAQAADPGNERATRRKLGLADDEPFILCNVEPTAEHSNLSWEEHWARFRSLMGALAESGVPVVLSLHPLCEPSAYRFAEDDYGFRLAGDKSLLELLPYCSVVVSYPSSLNPIVASLGKPLIIYDFLGSTHESQPAPDLYRIPGAPIVYDSDGLGPLVASLVHSANGSRTVSVAPDTSASKRSVSTVIERFGLSHT